MRQYTRMRRAIIAGSALLITACAPGVRDTESPAWAQPAITETARPVQLQGKWSLNASRSDDPWPLIHRAVESLRKNRRAVIGDGERRPGPGISAGEGPTAPGTRDPYRYAAVSDPRLAALRAESVSIEQDARTIRFIFDETVSVDYSIGQATSADQNINLSFADWEGPQFVVEKNGPDGLVLERWSLSPDGLQLYLLLSLEIKLPDFALPPEPVLIGRMFDRHT